MILVTAAIIWRQGASWRADRTNKRKKNVFVSGISNETEKSGFSFSEVEETCLQLTHTFNASRSLSQRKWFVYVQLAHAKFLFRCPRQWIWKVMAEWFTDCLAVAHRIKPNMRREHAKHIKEPPSTKLDFQPKIWTMEVEAIKKYLVSEAPLLGFN